THPFLNLEQAFLNLEQAFLKLERVCLGVRFEMPERAGTANLKVPLWGDFGSDTQASRLVSDYQSLARIAPGSGLSCE
ncbi:MAG: hypothetical protein KUG65_12775, partial [Sphingomonadaceae bacterium]|nr:hypothetical protein [Sphingomonadaceae bacterium]